MALVEIRLHNGVYRYDSQARLGQPGGFGTVYLGTDSGGRAVAVKRLHLDAAAAAHRELTIARDLAARPLVNVMPIIDAGQDAPSDSYFVVMPVADRSLQDFSKEVGQLGQSEASAILGQIADGLAEVSHIVHRDLKPANVLLYAGNWRIADFGIARFVEESTSLLTLKDCLSPHYAAPEQWRLERTTGATDLYALGCIAHVLVRGRPPFVGTVDQIREGHLSAVPEPLEGVRPQMRALVEMLLRKSPVARPPIERVKTTLHQLALADPIADDRPALRSLAVAAANHERKASEAEAERARQRAAADARQVLAADATSTLVGIAGELRRRVEKSAPSAAVSQRKGLLEIQVASARLRLDLDCRTYGEGAFPMSRWDVVCGAAAVVEQSSPVHRRSASLWFTRQESAVGEYRWYEVGYECNPLTGRAYQFEPTALKAEDADRAHSRALDVVQTSYHPVTIDGEDTDAFCDRWLSILAKACAGQLQNLPRSLPRFDD